MRTLAINGRHYAPLSPDDLSDISSGDTIIVLRTAKSGEQFIDDRMRVITITRLGAAFPTVIAYRSGLPNSVTAYTYNGEAWTGNSSIHEHPPTLIKYEEKKDNHYVSN